MSRGLVVDLFAGGGGASVGLEAALGRPVDIAVNHDPDALAAHKANHPHTRHLEADIWEVRPREATGGRPVDLLWASPDCTHFSVAKGSKPRSQKKRTLAGAVVRWARALRPPVIMLENVAEFRGWGPLDANGKPIKARMGEDFDRWRRKLERLGYVVDHRILDASLYGAPTRRRRLFLIARCDGQPIRWPDATHGKGLLPVHTAAECIDWSLPCPSIFERKKPLAEKTLWRIAVGIRRFVLENPSPFIVKVNHGKRDARGEPIDEPLTTVTAERRGHAVVTPALVEMNHSNAPHGVDEPLGVVTTQHNRFNLVAPTLVKFRHDSTGAQLDLPLPTITAGNGRADRPAGAGHALGIVAPTLIQAGYGERDGQAPRALDLHSPLGTVVAGGRKHALVSAFIAKHYGDRGQRPGLEMAEPLATITSSDHHSLAAICLAKFRGTKPSQPPAVPVTDPLPTISAGGIHVAEVRAFLTTYYSAGSVGQRPDAPLRTITAKHRLGLVTVAGVDYQIVDIGMRMLEPHELLRAQFGRFAADYDLSTARTKAAKVRLIGNSVCPEVAEAIVLANMPAQGAEVAA